MSKSATYEIEIPLIKIILIGKSGVGKTSIMRAFMNEVFIDSHLSTIGVDYRVKQIEVDGDMYKIQLIDTAGKEENILSNFKEYYRTANAFICVFDVTEPIDKVRENIRNARNQILNQGFPSDSFLLVIAGNKIENSEERKTSVEQGQTLASDFSSHFFEVSAKNNKYVDDLFQMTVKWVNEKTKDDYEAKAKRLLENNSKKKEDKKECCIIF